MFFDDENKYTGKVVHIVDEYKLVINKGESDGIEVGDIFNIFSLEDYIYDPDTGESLGRLEIVKGTARAIHVQNRITTIESIDYESSPDKQEIIKRMGTWTLGNQETVKVTPGEKVKKPFYNVSPGDLVLKK